MVYSVLSARIWGFVPCQIVSLLLWKWSWMASWRVGESALTDFSEVCIRQHRISGGAGNCINVDA